MGNEESYHPILKPPSISELESYIELSKNELKKLRNNISGIISQKKLEIINCLKENQLEVAKAKIDSLIREEKILPIYNILLPLLEILKEKLVYIISNNECPSDLRNTLDSIIYVSSRLEIKELLILRDLIMRKYGSSYIQKAECNADRLVNIELIERLKLEEKPNDEKIIKRLKQLMEEEISFELKNEILNQLNPSENEIRKDNNKKNIKTLKNMIEHISYLSEETIKNPEFKGLEEFKYLIANQDKILISLIGPPCSGKTSLLNALIGEEYLSTYNSISMKKGIIIEYTSDKHLTELYEIRLGIEYFKIEKIKKICDNKNKIREEIDKINNTANNGFKLEDNFLLLKVHIEVLDLFEEKYRKNILFIKYPNMSGLERNNLVYNKILAQTDIIFFVSPYFVHFNEISIINKKNNKSLLFILNTREQQNNYFIEKSRNDLIINNNWYHVFQKIDIVYFSALSYMAYLRKKNNILNFNNYFNTLIDEYEKKEEDNEEIYDYIMLNMHNDNLDLVFISNISNYDDNNYIEELKILLNNRNYELNDNHIKDIIHSYLTIASNINNHKLLIASNKNNLSQKIKEFIMIRFYKNKYILEEDINFLKNINNTINFIYDKSKKQDENNDIEEYKD